MTPGKISMPIYRGAKWEHDLLLKDSATGLPLDLSGLGPFVFAIKPPVGSSGSTVLVTVASAYDATGILNLSLTAEQTLALAPQSVRAGLRDAFNNPYAEGVLPVLPFTPDPA